MGAKGVETMVTVGVPTQSQRPVQGVDGRRRRCHLPRLLPHLITVTIAMVIRMKNIPCRASQAPTRWLTQGPQCWPHIPGTRELFTQTEVFTQPAKKEKRDKKCCVCKEGLLVHWVGGLVSGYQLISISGAHNTKTTPDDKPAKVTRDFTVASPRPEITLKR